MRTLYESILDSDFDGGMSNIAIAEDALMNVYFDHITTLSSDSVLPLKEDPAKWEARFNKVANMLTKARKNCKKEIEGTFLWPKTNEQLRQGIRESKIGILSMGKLDGHMNTLSLYYKEPGGWDDKHFMDYTIELIRYGDPRRPKDLPVVYVATHKHFHVIDDMNFYYLSAIELKDLELRKPSAFIISGETIEKFKKRL